MKKYISDAALSAFTFPQLEHINAEAMLTERPVKKGNIYVPMRNTVPEGAETHRYDRVVGFGKAKHLANGAKDVPVVNVNVVPTIQSKIKFGDGYEIDKDQATAAALANKPIQTLFADEAVEAAELFRSNLLLSGEDTPGRTGLINDPGVPITPASGTWTSILTATPTQGTVAALLKEIVGYFELYRQNTGENRNADTMLLPPSAFEEVTGTQIPNTTMTLYDFLTQRLAVYGIVTIDTVPQLTAGAANQTDNRAMIYQRTEDVVHAEFSRMFRFEEPIMRELDFKVPGWEVSFGTHFRRPYAALYIDGV